MDTTVVYTTAREEKIDIYNTPTPEALKFFINWDKYFLMKTNLESNAGEEGTAHTVRNIKKTEH